MSTLDEYHDQCALDNDDYVYCENCCSEFNGATGVRAKNGDLCCSDECAEEVNS